MPWREVASIGNVLRHAYHRVDDEVIYVIVTRQLEPLETAVRRLLDRSRPAISAEGRYRRVEPRREWKA